MTHFKAAGLMLVGLGLALAPLPAEAGSKRAPKVVEQGAEHSQSSYYRGTKVKGYVARRGGGYSYSAEDTINTYGDARGSYGAASSFRDPQFDRQTNAGPFDHGYFFETPSGTHGGDAPYMN